MSKIKQQQYQELLIKDQLNIERKDRKVFLHFGETWPAFHTFSDKRPVAQRFLFKTATLCLIVDEEEITFAPTYRFERDTREKYAYTKAKATGVSCQYI